MAQLAAFIPYIVAAGGTIMQGYGANAAAKSQAAQLEQNAGQGRAAAQREASERRRSARWLQSRVQALAAASGAGATDPTVANITADIATEGEYGALAAMYEGESAARGMEFGARVARRGGKAAEAAGAMRAAGTLLAGASSWYDKYGGGGAPGAMRKSEIRGTALSDFQNQNRHGLSSPRYA